MTIDASTTSIWYGGSKCTNIDFTFNSAVTCDVTAIESGDNKPLVFVD